MSETLSTNVLDPDELGTSRLRPAGEINQGPEAKGGQKSQSRSTYRAEEAGRPGFIRAPSGRFLLRLLHLRENLTAGRSSFMESVTPPYVSRSSTVSESDSSSSKKETRRSGSSLPAVGRIPTGPAKSSIPARRWSRFWAILVGIGAPVSGNVLSMATIFTKILEGEIPCHRVYEDKYVLAFLDINPLSPGHTLVIPKEPAATLDRLSDDSASAIGRVLPRISRAVLAATGATEFNILQNNGKMAHQEVMHVHFHIIPKLEDGQGLGVGWKVRGQLGASDGETLARQIQAEL